MPPSAPTRDRESSMHLLEHLRELRSRLIVSMVALAVGTAISFPFAERALEVLISPLEKKPLALAPTDTIVQYFKVALVGGIALASPVILYQLVRFLLPAFTERERRYLVFFLPFSLVLFIVGLLFAAFVAIPVSLSFLQQFGDSFAEIQYTLDSYVSFVTTMLLALGIGFELPNVVFLLAKLNLVSYQTLMKNMRWAFMAVAVVAAVLTPTPDIPTMSVVMVPLFLLYLLGVLMARFA